MSALTDMVQRIDREQARFGFRPEKIEVDHEEWWRVKCAIERLALTPFQRGDTIFVVGVAIVDKG
jgi:hypothetical protein